MEKVTYSQYQKVIRRKAWERFKKEHPPFDLIVPLGIGLIFAVIESFLIAGRIEPVRTASATVAITVAIYCILYIWYFSREHVFLYNSNNEVINSYIEKYETKPIEVDIDLDEWEYVESVSLGVTSIPPIPSAPTHRIISMVGIRVTNKENSDLTNVYGCLNSLDLLSYNGSHFILHEEATRNGSLLSWSGGSDDGEISIKPGKHEILKIAEGRDRDLVFMLQKLEYSQTVNGTYRFEIEIGGKIFDKPIEPHKQKFYISFDKLDKTFLGGEAKPYGSTDSNSTSVVKEGFIEYSKDSYRKLQIRKVTP